jgi:pyruvate-formate lyase-activating enzyme
MYAGSDGRLRTHESLLALGRSGWFERSPEGWVRMPEAATIVHLPGRVPHGMTRRGEVVSISTKGAAAVAAVLPPGYLRTWLPAYEQSPEARVLPLFGYAAVASRAGLPVVAAMRTDRWLAWDGRIDRSKAVRRGIEQALRALPDNRMIPHLQRCATNYRCLTAQHLFQRDGEGALPVSPACNAACLGCISEQWGDVDSPQERMAFAPTAQEIAELAAWHLCAGGDNFVSFGQGCEGEPLTRGPALVEATARIRQAFPQATIHINTNASRPRTLERMLEVGLNSVRISIFSLDEQRFKAYYRPVGYGLEDIERSAEAVQRAGAQLTVNLLTFPGITDSPPEIKLLLGFLSRHRVHQVQLRTLNVDPLWLLERTDPLPAGIGMRDFVRRLRASLPHLRLGNFTRRWPVATVEGSPDWASSTVNDNALRPAAR